MTHVLCALNRIALAASLFVLAGCRAEVGTGASELPEVAVQSAALGWPLGNVDSVARHTVEGWACIADYPKPLWAHVYVDGTWRGSTVANNINRPDAAHLCGGRSWHGFSWALPRLTDGAHTVAVYVSTGPVSTTSKLPGASSVRYPYAWDPAVPGRPIGWVEALTPTEIRGWTCDPDRPSSAIDVHAYIQYDGNGPLTFLAGGRTSLNRPDTAAVCGGSGNLHGFVIPLPVVRGGNHNVIVYGIDTPPSANHNRLDETSNVPDLVAFPYERSEVVDPTLDHAAGCWRGWAGFDHVEDPVTHQIWNYQYKAPHADESFCPGGGAQWFLSGDGYTFWGYPPLQPQPYYSGLRTRLRYDDLVTNDSSLTASTGFVMRVDTRPSNDPLVDPCKFHFQAIQNNSGGQRMLDPGLQLEVQLKVRSTEYAFSDSPDPGGCISRPWELGYEGFQHVLVALTFDNIESHRGYFLELVPYWDTHQPNFGGNMPAWQGHGGYGNGIDSSADTYEGRNGAGPANFHLIRVAMIDGRIAPYVSSAARMTIGEQRTYYVDLRGVFQAAFPRAMFPDADISKIRLGGYYVGTEHWNASAIALEVRRLSIVKR